MLQLPVVLIRMSSLAPALNVINESPAALRIVLTIRVLVVRLLKLLTVCPGPPPEPSGANRGCVGETFVAKGI